ncbi:2-oxoglutarate (2OG) and Fe(II)-dependent oxygenase superfamily protein [Quillaja saponaria]|uniref:2-oxoglutarate (2OG) and Fe(II)-dependent oxygenase superfamily protein n=1 Tax=Quillaja saponaria TaxID=32244 RepID=A0AAD7KS38_QUISA|nr:2-oxoglutarate (2OG) and Fe(II)-dependent oxygenase superfamily protein [Quillaja saponaria]
MTETLKLPIIDLSSPDRISTANTIRQACIEYGFFYLVNHGVEKELLEVTRHSMPESLDPTSNSKGDSKESYDIGSLGDVINCDLNQWPSKEILPNWRSTMESFYWKVFAAGTQLLPLIALSLDLDEEFFEKVGAMVKPETFLRLLHYPGDFGSYDEELYGASAHSDYGMITLLASDDVQGLQVCREKFKQPRLWEDVPHVEGSFIINIGDMMERWTNCLYRSTLHRVIPAGKERYSVAFFFDPDPDCVVECIESCCNESSPPRFSPIRSGDYLQEKLRNTYAS